MQTTCPITKRPLQPKVIIIRRRANQGFGFTLRHFIAYPPQDETSWPEKVGKHEDGLSHTKPMETIFIKEVQYNGPAYLANLQTGDRVLMVNNIPISGITYGAIVAMIKKSSLLTLHVVSKEFDVLQMHFNSIAHTPETNRCLSTTPGPYFATIYSSSPGSVRPCALLQNSDVVGLSCPVNSLNRSDDQFTIGNAQLSARIPKSDISTVSQEVQQYPFNSSKDKTGDISYTSAQNASLQSTSQYHNHDLCSASSNGNSDLMVRLRESIKQKEEFLKSPHPCVSTQHPQNFLSKTSPSCSPQLCHKASSVQSTLSTLYFSGLKAQTATKPNIQLNTELSNLSVCNVRGLVTRSCDMNNLYSRNDAINSPDDSLLINLNNTGNSGVKHKIRNSSNSMWTKSFPARYSSNVDNMDNLQDTGVTNKVFERKLASHFARRFDPFAPLTINTNSLDSTSVSSNNTLSKEVTYGLLEQHPVNKSKISEFYFPEEMLNKQTSDSNSICSAKVVQQIEHIDLKKTDSRPTKILSVENTTTNSAEKKNLNGTVEYSNFSNFRDTGKCYKAKDRSLFDDSKPMRRISYLRATNNEVDDFPNDFLTLPKIPSFPDNDIDIKPESINSLEPIYNDVVCSDHSAVMSSGMKTVESFEKSGFCTENDFHNKSVEELGNDVEVFETDMEIKVIQLNGKRITDSRSWRQVKVDIRGDFLSIHTRSLKLENNILQFDIKNFSFIDESNDKKKYIFRMQSKPVGLYNQFNVKTASKKYTSPFIIEDAIETSQTPTDILFKTKNSADLKRIFGLLQWKNSLNYDDNEIGKQLAEPQKTAATSSISSVMEPVLKPEKSAIVRRETALYESITPVMKPGKSPSHKNFSDKDLGSPKSKNWRDLLFRRGGSTCHSAEFQTTISASTAKTFGSIGVPLKACPMSSSNEYVPHLVDVCTYIVETKGLGIVGIYRIPGNKAAISELSEQVNKHDFSWDRCYTDVRWEDVNVVSSLLKLFIRSLPDALLPTSFYNQFIEADKKEGLERLIVLKELLESLPRHSYETMKHLIRHLNRVSKNCDVNLMEPKNLAIIFGPSIIRTPNDTLEIAVKNMKHQYRIVELLVTQYEYFFENGELPDERNICGNSSLASVSSNCNSGTQEDQTKMLLHNVSKIERFSEREGFRASRFIPQLRGRTHHKRGTGSSDTYSEGSELSLDFIKAPAFQSSMKYCNNPLLPYNKDPFAKKDSSIFVVPRKHLEKIGLDEKKSANREKCNSVDMSITLTDDDSNNSRFSDAGSMSLTTITDTLESKLRNLRSGSESNDENDSPDAYKNFREVVDEPLHLHSENIPYADESPERCFQNFTSCKNERAYALKRSLANTNIKLRTEKDVCSTLPSNRLCKLKHQATVSCGKFENSATASNAAKPSSVLSVIPTLLTSIEPTHHTKNLRFSTSVNEDCCSEDDSEGSTTSNPKESLIPSTLHQERQYKRKRGHNLFRSASLNCRNYSPRHHESNNSSNVGALTSSGLTKDEKTDMNLTKKRQIKNKQNRSIKRRHTVGGPLDFSATNSIYFCNFCNKKNGPLATVFRKSSLPQTKNNVKNNIAQGDQGLVNNASAVSVSNNRNEHMLQFGIRMKNLNRNRF